VKKWLLSETWLEKGERMGGNFRVVYKAMQRAAVLVWEVISNY